MCSSRLEILPRWDWRWWVAGLALAIQAFHLFWILATPAGGRLLPYFGNTLIDASHALSAILVLAVAARYWGSRTGLAWGLIGLGLAFGQFGESSWTFQELVLGDEVPFPSVSDIGYVGAYLPVFAGVLLMPQAPTTRFGRLKLAVDTLIIMSAVALVSWVLVIEGLFRDAEETVLAQALSVFYPLADLGIIFAVFILVARAAGSRFALAFGLLAAGYFATAFSDSLYIYLANSGYEVGSYVDFGWVAASSLISLAALTALGHAATAESRVTGRGRPTAFWPSLLSYVAVIPLGALLLLDSGSGTLLTAGFLAVLSLIVLRQVLAIYENVRLNAELTALTAQLDYRVKEKTMQLLRASRPGETPPATGGRPNGADEQVGGLRPGAGG